MLVLLLLQTTASPPQESHLSALTSDPLWQCVRKGTSPAFSPTNMRCTSSTRQCSLQPVQSISACLVVTAGAFKGERQ